MEKEKSLSLRVESLDFLLQKRYNIPILDFFFVYHLRLMLLSTRSLS